MEIVPVPDVAQRANKAPVPRTVVDLGYDPAFAVVEKFDQQVEQVHGFCGTVGVRRRACFDRANSLPYVRNRRGVRTLCSFPKYLALRLFSYCHGLIENSWWAPPVAPRFCGSF